MIVANIQRVIYRQGRNTIMMQMSCGRCGHKRIPEDWEDNVQCPGTKKKVFSVNLAYCMVQESVTTAYRTMRDVLPLHEYKQRDEKNMRY